MTARIIPFVFILFVIAALARNNIGFAALTINKELGITSQQYGFIGGIIFFGYAIFEVARSVRPGGYRIETTTNHLGAANDQVVGLRIRTWYCRD